MGAMRFSRAYVSFMKSWIRVGCCVWFAACGSAPPANDPEPAPRAEPCERPGGGIGHPNTLLRVGCDGVLQAGRARWSVTDGAVTLDFGAGATEPTGAEIVATWPPISQPPWRGHRVEQVMILSRGRIRVAFRDPVRDQARLFADPRLAGVGELVAEGDARDAIDRNREEVVTRHDASIEYARSLSRPVRLVEFDRLYMVAFADTADSARMRAFAAAVGQDWIARGAQGARRPPSVSWAELGRTCPSRIPGMKAAASDEISGTGRGAVRRPAGIQPTVSYPENDVAGRQIAERMVSAALRRDGQAAVLGALTGARTRLGVRPATHPLSPKEPSDVAAVFRVQTGSAHPCSVRGEVLWRLETWDPTTDAGRRSLMLVGEVAAFSVGSTGPRGFGRTRAAGRR